MSDIKFTHRETHVITVAQLNQDFLRPESIRIQLDKAVRVSPLDVGCLGSVRKPKKYDFL